MVLDHVAQERKYFEPLRHARPVRKSIAIYHPPPSTLSILSSSMKAASNPIRPVQRVDAVRREGNVAARDVLAQDLQIARALARVLDSQFEIQGVKFGLDAVLGLIPVAGDVISTAIGLYPIYLARKHRLGRLTILKMFANLGADFVVGALPLAGDVFDVFFKAHQKNYQLLEVAARARGIKLENSSGV